MIKIIIPKIVNHLDPCLSIKYVNISPNLYDKVRDEFRKKYFRTE